MPRPHPLGWPNALHPARSPCRIDRTKGRQQHPCSASHADVVTGYRLWRETWEDAAEAATIGYATEMTDYRRDHPAPTFRTYLTDRRAPR
jgi:hypothetical protein